MIPMRPLRLSLGTSFASDPAYLAPAQNPNKIVLVKNNPPVSENMTLENIVPADFTGSAPIDGLPGAQQVGVDPNTMDQVVTIKDPLGGFRWITGDNVNLPQTIYGYALLTANGTSLLAYMPFTAPMDLLDQGQEINLGKVQFRINPQPIN